MFGLREHVGRHVSRAGRFVSHHEHLAGSGRHVDGHGALHELLGLGHVAVARTEDFVHPRHARCAVGHGGHGLGAAHADHAVHAAEFGGIEDFGRNLPAASLGRAEDHLGTTCNLGGQGEHQHGGEERGASAGDVEAHALDGHGVLLADHAALGFHLHDGGQLCGVEGADVARGGFHGALHLRGNLFGGTAEFPGPYGEVAEFSPVEAAGKVAQGLVAAAAYLFYDFPDAQGNAFVVGDIPDSQFVPRRGRGLENDFHILDAVI